MIGHALAFAPRPGTRLRWDRAIAYGFAIGSLCFFVGPFPGFIQAVGAEADAVVFFIGSLFFTVAALLEVRESTVRLGRWAADRSWWSAAVQFVGTLFFNVSTFDVMLDGLSTQQENRLIWAPNAFGSICFLVSSLLAYRVASGTWFRPRERDHEWHMAAVNLLGSLLFGISAIASVIVPSTGSMLDLAAANWTTSLGGLCFLIGALMVMPRSEAHRPKARAMA
jgi:YrhK-like protein